jgi:transglutaminase-like putative cysteine protease
VSDAIAYRPGTTHAHTTAAEALAQGEGVCQDHAHALIAAARAGGVPARYVSGYLQAGVGTSDEAAHAWAELFVAGFGWIGFDPANRCCPDARYIRLGSGLDAAYAAPIRGTARGAGAESLDVTVAVQMQDQ